MGYLTEFNWILKLKLEQGLSQDKLEIDMIHDFSKDGARNYPLKYPILLVNNDWEAVGTVEILNFLADKDKTTGKYKIIKIHEGLDREVLTNFLQFNIRYYKKDKNKNFSELKAT